MVAATLFEGVSGGEGLFGEVIGSLSFSGYLKVAKWPTHWLVWARVREDEG